MILANNIVKRFGDQMELESGYLPFDEDVFQWFIIDDPDFAINNTYEPVFYDSDLDLYILAVTHWGPGWCNVPPPRLKGDIKAYIQAKNDREEAERRRWQEYNRNR